MSRAIILMGLIIMTLLALLTLLTAHASIDASATDVSGNFTTDQTWNLTGSPWVVVNTTIFKENATLTIEPGVEVVFDGMLGILCEENASVRALGKQDRRITFTTSRSPPWKPSWYAVEMGVNGTVSYCDFEYGMECLRANHSAKVTRCTFNRSTKGVVVLGDDVTVKGCTAYRCDIGFLFSDCMDSALSDCVVTHCKIGVGSEYWSAGCTVEGFEIDHCDDGCNFQSQGTDMVVKDMRIQDCKNGVSCHLAGGFTIEQSLMRRCSDAGIRIETCYFSGFDIEGCVIERCDTGMKVLGSRHVSVRSCNLRRNDLGLSAQGNTEGAVFFFGNNFLENKEQVFSSNSNTSYHYEETGNYWSDYRGEDRDENGVGDFPYYVEDVIYGFQLDEYPSMNPFDRMSPVAVAGTDMVVEQHGAFELNASGSYDDSWISNWTWKLNVGGSVIELNGTIAMAVIHLAGVFTVELEISDQAGRQGRDTLKVTVLDRDAPSLLSVVALDTGYTGDPFNITCSVDDNVAVTEVVVDFECDANVSGRVPMYSLGGNRWGTDLPVPANVSRELTYTVVTMDAEGNANASQRFTITVLDNDPPVLGPLLPEHVTTGGLAYINCTVYENVELRNVTVELWCKGVGTIRANLSFANLTEEGELWSVELLIPSQALGPMWVNLSAMDASGNVRMLLPRMLAVIDDDPPVLVEDLTVTPFNKGSVAVFKPVLLDNLGIVAASVEVKYEGIPWKSTELVDAGEFYTASIDVAGNKGYLLWYRYIVEDGNGNALEMENVMVELNSHNPVILTEPPMEVNETTPYTVIFVAEDVDSDEAVLGWVVLTNATWLSFDPMSATLSGTPTGEDIGTYWLLVTVADDGGGRCVLNYTLTVLDVDFPPVLELFFPEEGYVVQGELEVKGAVEDDSGAVERVSVRVDGGEWMLAEGTSLWKLVIEAGKLAPGEHEIEVVAFDGVQESAALNVTVVVPKKKDDKDGPGYGVPMAVAALVAIALLVPLSRGRGRVEE